MANAYILTELQALPDADLNALAAELWGVTCPLCKLRHRLSSDKKNHMPSQSIGMIEMQPCKMAGFLPVTDRNQSGELLVWAIEHGCQFDMSLTAESEIDFCASGGDWSTISIDSGLPRAETIAFCAAMLAMEGRLDATTWIEEGCEQCGKPEPSGFAACEDCSDRICNACAIPEWDVPRWGNSSIFRCADCDAKWRESAEVSE